MQTRVIETNDSHLYIHCFTDIQMGPDHLNKESGIPASFLVDFFFPFKKEEHVSCSCGPLGQPHTMRVFGLSTYQNSDDKLGKVRISILIAQQMMLDRMFSKTNFLDGPSNIQ